MRKIIGVSLSGFAVYALPLIAAAQDDVSNFLKDVNVWVNLLVGILLILGVVVFFWGLIKYLTAVGEEKHKGLMIMFYGVLTITVMVAIWGLVRFFQNALIPGKSTTAPGVYMPPPRGQ